MILQNHYSPSQDTVQVLFSFSVERGEGEFFSLYRGENSYGTLIHDHHLSSGLYSFSLSLQKTVHYLLLTTTEWTWFYFNYNVTVSVNGVVIADYNLHGRCNEYFNLFL